MQGKSLSIIILTLFVPLPSHATEIRQRPFSPSIESAVVKKDDQFVVCSDCQDNQLTMIPKNPKPALRIAMPLKLEVTATREVQKIPESNSQAADRQIRLVPIQFDFDSAQLTWPVREKLNRFMANLSKSSTYDLTGFTCTIGRGDYNEKLSIRRANLVADIFKANGLNVGKVEGRGKCCPVSEDMRLNRRVEILEHRKEEK